MDKLKKSNEFQTIYKTGRKSYGKFFLIFYKKNNLNKNSFGFVASKKVGNAVCRNKLKRLFKEYCRLEETRIKLGYDLVIVAKRTAGENFKELSYKEIEKDFENVLKISKLFEN